MERVEILGTRIDNLSMRGAIQRVVEKIEAREFSFAVTPNVDHLMKLRKDPTLRSVYQEANLVLADGVPLLWASRLLGTPLKERINGTDFFEELSRVAAERGYSIYLLGGNQGAAESAARALIEQNPGLRVAGWYCPRVGFEQESTICEEVRQRIQDVHPDILFVGLGAPKQERWIQRYAQGVGVSFAVGIGISFSLISGEIRRAPQWMQRSGLEWLWRLGKEPARLWKRYLIDDMPFLLLIAQMWLHKVLVARAQNGWRVRSHAHAVQSESENQTES